MDFSSNIMVTGAAGFIGSCLVGFLNSQGFENLILVDDFTGLKKISNLEGKKFIKKIEREELFDFLKNNDLQIDFVFHLGARTDTTEFDYSVHEHLNVAYSKKIWNFCSGKKIPLVYASSAATYGRGELGYQDDEMIIYSLKPLNPYGISKNEFDKWAIAQEHCPPKWSGLKFFNVYGPNEYHKARMASVIFHSYNQIEEKGLVKLFKSHKEEYENGGQLRDFVYVKDILKICFWFMKCWQSDPETFITGIYNVGTGKARTFKDLARATFAALDLPVNIEYIDMPEDIRDSYQYYTQAPMKKLRNAGYQAPFYSLEEGINDYIKNYLSKRKYY